MHRPSCVISWSTTRPSRATPAGTVDEYFLDLRNFFRFLKLDKGRVARNTPLDEISIDDVDLDLVRSVTSATCMPI